MPLKQSWLQNRELLKREKYSVEMVNLLFKEWDKYIDDMFRQDKWTDIIDHRIDPAEVMQSLQMINQFYSFIQKTNV
jgi:hypothetical protein